MQLGARGAALIKSFETLAFVAYRNFPGEPWTCGWGHTGADVTEGTTCDTAGAETWFAGDTQKAVQAVLRLVDVALTQNQFDALVSFAFNLGTGALASSTLLRLVNAGRFADAADEFPKWDHVNGKVVAGLVRRRAAERALFVATS